MKMAAQIMSGMGCTNSSASLSSRFCSFWGSSFLPKRACRSSASSSVSPSSPVANSNALSAPQ